MGIPRFKKVELTEAEKRQMLEEVNREEEAKRKGVSLKDLEEIEDEDFTDEDNGESAEELIQQTKPKPNPIKKAISYNKRYEMVEVPIQMGTVVKDNLTGKETSIDQLILQIANDVEQIKKVVL